MSLTPYTFAESWIAAWNAHDLDAVLAHFSDDFVFSSPLICQFTEEKSGRLVGKHAVRSYWEIGLSRLPDLHFELIDVLVGVDCLTIVYSGHRGLSAEVLTLGQDGRAVQGQACYGVK
ncbi:MAG: nuclear transport factor 2 family protein [Sulfuriferula sp.]|nr:nuclear transport factor 2 family protein [Sulfuriferula sp.]